MSSQQPPDFGDVLRRTRIRAGLTQEGLAEVSGLSVRAISNLERGVNRAPHRDTIARLAGALGLSQRERRNWDQARSAVSIARRQPTSRTGPASQSHAAIPQPLTSLIGREGDVARIVELARLHRLVTLTGPGGVGKTRLAIAVAQELGSEYPDGALFVDLAPVRDPAHVITSVATALGARRDGERPLIETVVAELRNMRFFIVLDNVEHVLGSADTIADLLARCPGIQICVTSRAPLRLTGEQRFVVEPLDTPGLVDQDGVAEVSGNPSIRLFVQTATNVRHTFSLTAENAPAVAAICRRVDGLPLAIELAAARINLLPPHVLFERLQHSLDILAGPVRDRPDRQQTIRMTVHWSYELLSADDQSLFRRLSAFPGGGTFDTAAAITDERSTVDVVEALERLLEHSLIRARHQANGFPRFEMLAPIREYGQELARQAGEWDDVHDALLTYYLRLSKNIGSSECEAEFGRRLDDIENELANIRAVLDWVVARGDERIFELLHGLWHLWFTRGYTTEGRAYLRTALERCQAAPPAARVRALYEAGTLASWQGDTPEAYTRHKEGLRLADDLGDQNAAGWSLLGLGRAAAFDGDFRTSRDYLQKCIALATNVGNILLKQSAAGNLAKVYALEEDVEQAFALLDKWLPVEGDDESSGTLRIRLLARAEIAFVGEQFAESGRLIARALTFALRAGDQSLIPQCVELIGRLAAATDHPQLAARLIGWTQHRKDVLRTHLPVTETSINRLVAELRQQLGDDEYEQLSRQGRSATHDSLIAVAIRFAEGDIASDPP